MRGRSRSGPVCMAKKAPDWSGASFKDQGAERTKTPKAGHSYRAHALDEFPKDHPGHDPGVPVYTAATGCVRETEMGAPTSGPH